jgi:GxxExxY protein
MLVEDCVLLELKSAKALDSAPAAQLLNYLYATEIEVGLLLNFGLKPEFKRLIFDNPRRAIRGNPCSSVADIL